VDEGWRGLLRTDRPDHTPREVAVLRIRQVIFVDGKATSGTDILEVPIEAVPRSDFKMASILSFNAINRRRRMIVETPTRPANSTTFDGLTRLNDSEV
jgi:hypothetical protein